MKAGAPKSEFPAILGWCETYMSIQIFVPVSAIFVKNNKKNKMCAVKIIHIININRIVIVIFMVLEKKVGLCYLSLSYILPVISLRVEF
jgi:hypothetical protein